MSIKYKMNWFKTLSEALESEGLEEVWDAGHIGYDQTKTMTHLDGSKYGHFISIYRNEQGLYERPVHYSRG